MLQQAVFQLIDHHQDVEALILESSIAPPVAPSGEDHGNEQPRSKQSVSSLLAVLQEQSQVSGIPLQTLTASLSAARIKSMLGDHHSQESLLLTSGQQDLVEVFVTLIQKVQTDHGFSKNLFIKLLNKEFSVPIELIWRLHTENIMPLDAYITCNLSRPDVVGKLSKAVAQLCQSSSQDTLVRRSSIVSDLVGFLIKLGYAEKAKEDSTTRGLKKVSCALLDSITKKVFNNHDKSTINPELDVDIFESSFATLDVDPAVLKKLCSRQLGVLVSVNPSWKVSQALNLQHQWTYAKMPAHITSIYRQLLVVFEASEVIDLLQNILEQEEVNWKWVLSLVATTLLCFPLAPGLLKETIAQMLKKAMENSELDGLITGFLLARQGALEGLHVSPTYQDWFYDMFGDQTSCANSKRSFVFLLKFLTDIVPYEAPQYLKAHIMKPPYVPPKCRPVLSDYTTLAKTRLLDLKESLEDLGIYDSDTRGSAAPTSAELDKRKQQAAEDVEKALEWFDRTGKVPSSIMEASIFRKPYFIGRFLPSLLTPRPLPDIPDTQMKFIEAMNKADKIPQSLLKAYEEGCKKSAAELLEGVFNVDEDEDDDMADLLLSPWQQLQGSLQSVQEAVVRQQSQQHKLLKTPSVSAQISRVVEKLSNLLGEPDCSSVQPGARTELDMDSAGPPAEKTCRKIGDALLTTIHATLAESPGGATRHLTWLNQLLAVASQYSGLHRAMLVKIWALITQQGPGLEEKAVSGLSAIILQLSTSPAPVEHIFIKHRGGKGPYVEQILISLPVTSQGWMYFCLRFCTSYLMHAFNSYTDVSLHPEPDRAVVPLTVLKRFLYLVPRLCPEVRYGAHHQAETSHTDQVYREAVRLYQGLELQQLRQQVQLPLEDWATLEFSVSSCEDCMDLVSRQQYQDWCIHQCFLPTPTDQGGCGGSVHKLCSTLLSVLLKQTARLKIPGCSSGKPSQHLVQNSRAEMLLLLQRCIQLLTRSRQNEKATGDDHVWLVTSWKEHAVFTEGHTVKKEADVQSFFSIAQCLPSYLLLSNQPLGEGCVLPSTVWEDLVEVINGPLRDHLTTGTCLQHSITVHLLQCLLQLPQTDANTAAVDVCLSRCPVMCLSLLWHWPTLQYLLSPCVIERSAMHAVIEKLGEIAACVSRVLDDGSTDDLLQCRPSWLCGAAIYIKMSGMKEFGWEKTVALLSRLMSGSAAGSLALESGFQDCALGSLAWDYLFGHPNMNTMSTLLELWCSHPALLDQLVSDLHDTDSPSTVTACFPDVVKTLMPVVAWRVLLRADSLSQGSLVSKAASTRALLQLHNKLGQVYETVAPPGGEETTHSLLSMQLMTEVSQFLKQTVLRAPKSFLQQIPQDVLHQSDEDVKRYIEHLLH